MKNAQSEQISIYSNFDYPARRQKFKKLVLAKGIVYVASVFSLSVLEARIKQALQIVF
jgi:hypothetical protein